MDMIQGVMLKKWVVWFIGAVLLISVAGCGSGKEDVAPNVMGIGHSDAKTVLENAGFEVTEIEADAETILSNSSWNRTVKKGQVFKVNDVVYPNYTETTMPVKVIDNKVNIYYAKSDYTYEKPDTDADATEDATDYDILTPDISSTPDETPKPDTTSTPDANNPYITLSQEDRDLYLFLLRIIGECYIDLALSEDMVDEMQKDERLSKLVSGILQYKTNNDALLPEFEESFMSFFSNGNDLTDYPDENEALATSFTLKYEVFDGHWTITPKKLSEFTVTLNMFNRVENGMTYQEVVAIFKVDGELQSEVDLGVGAEYATQMYSWKGNDSISSVIITFQGGKVVTKTQFGLK